MRVIVALLLLLSACVLATLLPRQWERNSREGFACPRQQWLADRVWLPQLALAQESPPPQNQLAWSAATLPAAYTPSKVE